jgi:propanediol utilization protein
VKVPLRLARTFNILRGVLVASSRLLANDSFASELQVDQGEVIRRKSNTDDRCVPCGEVVPYEEEDNRKQTWCDQRVAAGTAETLGGKRHPRHGATTPHMRLYFGSDTL